MSPSAKKSLLESLSLLFISRHPHVISRNPHINELAKVQIYQKSMHRSKDLLFDYAVLLILTGMYKNYTQTREGDASSLLPPQARQFVKDC